MTKTKTMKTRHLPSLGKGPARIDHRTLSLTRYLKTLAPPPATADWGEKIAHGHWPMMLNDNLGDCTAACAGHMIEEWTTYSGKPFTPTNLQIQSFYSATSGYIPGQPNTDNGAVILDVLNYWRQSGLAGHKIQSYVSVNPLNVDEMKDAVNIFGNCYLGIQLPVTVQGASMWLVPPGGPQVGGNNAPGSWGGHAIPIIAYATHYCTVVSWGGLIQVSWDFITDYADEAYAVLSQDWLNSQAAAPNSLDLAQLEADLNLITSA